AWFGYRSETPVTFGRVEFAHGRSMVHGGWFDASRGLPVIEVLDMPGTEWRAIGELGEYPTTDASSDAGILPGQLFELALDVPVAAYGLRVRGAGSYGEYPGSRRIATCATLTAFDD
ncbi:MAG: hypothetical protein ABUL47_04955, partial [Leifsonia sp.]